MILTRSIAILIVVGCLGITFVFGLMEKNNLLSPQQIHQVQAEENFVHRLQPITSQLKPQDKDSSQYEVILSIDEKWDEISIPILLKMTVRNNSSEVIHLSINRYDGFEGLIIKDAEGKILSRNEEEPGISPSGEKIIKVREASYTTIPIEPKKEYVKTIHIFKEYSFEPLKEYYLTVKKIIVLAKSELLTESERVVEVTSSPVKLVVKSDKE